ncbi:hypothetical protein AAIH70_26665 [Neorhizobium sp. BT27B]|uniref:hypothetical protein n=1 Tax=Neorhizobium sp. BT27B TaxID=3142625 RepID=UPI003D2B8E43
MDDLKEFARSSNGDSWLLEQQHGSRDAIVVHRGNPPSGGHETRMPAQVFLDRRPATPEQDALRRILSETAHTPQSQHDDETREDGKTPSLLLAEEYIRLGGKRRAKVDDNIVSTRDWEGDTQEAAAFWNEKIQPLEDKSRREVELHLPSISDV